MRVFGVFPMVPLVGNIGTNGTICITIFTIFAPISLLIVPLVIKLVQMVKCYQPNGTIGEPRTHAMVYLIICLNSEKQMTYSLICNACL